MKDPSENSKQLPVDAHGPGSEAYLSTIIAASHDAILVVDEMGRFEFGNEAFFRIFGWPRDELIGHHFIKVVPPDLHDFIIARWEEVQRGDGNPYEVDIVTKDGDRRSLAVSHRHVDIHGSRKYCVVVKDVTERKKMEQRLRLLASAVEQSFEGIALVDLEGHLQFLNDAFARVHGYSVEELAGKHLSVFHTAEQMPSVDAANRQIQETGTFTGEIWHVHRDGTPFPTLMQNSLLRDEQGRAVGIIGTLRDISDLKNAENELRKARDELEHQVLQRTEELRKREETYRTLVETIPHGIQEIDASGRITFVNRAYCAMLGYEPEELYGKDIFDVLSDDEQRERLKRYLKEIVESQPTPTPYFETNLTKQGKLIDVQVDWDYKRDANGTVQGFVSVITDITERNTAREKLEGEATLLRKLLDLQEQERKLVAHEIHDGFVQDVVGAKMMLEGELDMLESNEPLQLDRFRPIGDLLEKAIRESRRMISELRPLIIDEEGIVAAITHLISQEYSDSGLQVDFSSSLDSDRLDPMLEGAVFRIVQEGLTNVKRHGQCDSAEVELTMQDGRLLLEICDEGAGFDPNLVPNERFGLRGICERARLFGGQATIDSEPGKGTRIRVDLPATGKAENRAPSP